MSTPEKETVLVLGATGNIGTAAVLAALRSGRNVLAAVRNQNSADKLFSNVKDGVDRIITVEADVISDKGVQGIVDKVRSGTLPAFQHVYATIGGEYTDKPLLEASVTELRHIMQVNFDSNFSAYIATIPYLLEQKDRDTSFTVCTGASGDMGLRALPAISQGALYSMSYYACHALAKTNVRYNEAYLAMLVQLDTEAEKNEAMSSSYYSRVYEQILDRKDIKSSRVRIARMEDVENLRVEPQEDRMNVIYG